MMHFQFIPRKDLLAIACATREVNQSSALYRDICSRLKQGLRTYESTLSAEDSSARRAAFANLLENQLPLSSDRLTAVSCALTAIKAITNDQFVPTDTSAFEVVTNDNCADKMGELLDLLAAYRPGEQDINRLMEGMGKHASVKHTIAFCNDRYSALAAEATALCMTAQKGELSAFGKDLTAEQAVQFMLADEAVYRLHAAVKAGKTGEIIGRLLCAALLLCAFVGGVFAVCFGVASLISVSVGLAIGVWTAVCLAATGALIYLSTDGADTLLDMMFDAAGDMGARLAAEISLKLSENADADIPEVDVSEEEPVQLPDEPLPAEA